MHAHKLRTGIIYIYSGGLDEHLLLPLSPSTLRSSVALNSIPFPADEYPPNRAFSQSGSFPLRSLYRLHNSLFFSCLLTRSLSLFLTLLLLRSLSSLRFLHHSVPHALYTFPSLRLPQTHERTHTVSIDHANPELKRRRRWHYLIIINIDFIAAKMCNRFNSTPSYEIAVRAQACRGEFSRYLVKLVRFSDRDGEI